jgi:RNA polymerase sigma-70 factor, ECF subfamily
MTEDSLTKLYRQYGAIIYARCSTLLADASAAEDATQETFVRVHRHLARAESVESVLFWIHRIATNLCLNELRNRKTRPIPADLPPDALTDGRAEQRISDRQLAAQLVDCSPPKVRSVAWLYHVDGFDQAEVAAIMGVSRRTVVNQLAQFAQNARKASRRDDK